MSSRCLVDVTARAFEVVLNAGEVTVIIEVGPAAHAHQETFNAEGNHVRHLSYARSDSDSLDMARSGAAPRNRPTPATDIRKCAPPGLTTF